ncbi:MAG: 6-bladed beta-propeller [Dehalococcoidia bacterium]
MVTQIVAGRVFDYSHCVGRGGVTGMGFNSAIDLTVGSDGKVYVLNRGLEAISAVPWSKTARGARVGVYHIGSAPGEEEWLSEFSKNGDEPGELTWPAGVALDSQGNTYVTDEWLNRISVWDKEGNFLTTWGTTGEGEGEFNGPSGIACDADDNIYVVDSRNHRVQKLTKEGRFLAQWGSFGSGEGQFDSPWGMTLDREGYVYIADHKNSRVQKFTAEGEYVAQFGRYGTGRGELNRPSGVAVDPDGDVYVCDWGNSRIQVFGPDGRFLTSLLGDAVELSEWTKMIVDTNPDLLKRRREVKDREVEWRLEYPSGLAFDENNSRLLIADTQRNRIQIYNKVKNYAEPAKNL